ncbi:MAG: hypothetical protein ACREB6_16415 [Rhodospirillales bacterium]
MRAHSILLFSALFIGSWTIAVTADDGLKPGMVVEGFVRVPNTYTQVALPEGKWEVAGVIEKANSVGTYFLMANLVQVADGKVSKAIHFFSPMRLTTSGFVENKFCLRNDMHFRRTLASGAGQDQDCRWVNHLRLTLAGSKDELKNSTGKYLEAKNIAIPNHLIDRGFRFADQFRDLNVHYFINPELDGFPAYPRTTWTDGPWHPQNTASDAKKKAYIDRQIAWVEEWYPMVKAGWEGKLTEAPKAPTASATSATK